MADWLDALAACRGNGTPCVLVTMVVAEGSTPREAGAKMLVDAAGQSGSIGGGHLEFKAAEIARAMLLQQQPAPRLERFPLGPALGQCCGGSATLLFEPMLPPQLQVILFGAGHVGTALATVLGTLPCRVRWYDSREGQFPAGTAANVEVLVTEDPVAEMAEAPADACLLVMTHSHQLDYDLCEAALRRGDFRYLGLIGSRSKRRRFEARLLHRGVPAAALARLTCPIGLPGIGGKHPGEIAVSVAAELVGLAGRADLPAGREAAETGAG